MYRVLQPFRKLGGELTAGNLAAHGLGHLAENTLLRTGSHPTTGRHPSQVPSPAVWRPLRRRTFRSDTTVVRPPQAREVT